MKNAFLNDKVIVLSGRELREMLNTYIPEIIAKSIDIGLTIRDLPPAMTIPDVSRALGLSTTSIRRYIDHGHLKCRLVQKKRLIYKEDLFEFLNIKLQNEKNILV